MHHLTWASPGVVGVCMAQNLCATRVHWTRMRMGYGDTDAMSPSSGAHTMLAMHTCIMFAVRARVASVET